MEDTSTSTLEDEDGGYAAEPSPLQEVFLHLRIKSSAWQWNEFTHRYSCNLGSNRMTCIILFSELDDDSTHTKTCIHPPRHVTKHVQNKWMCTRSYACLRTAYLHRGFATQPHTESVKCWRFNYPRPLRAGEKSGHRLLYFILQTTESGWRRDVTIHKRRICVNLEDLYKWDICRAFSCNCWCTCLAQTWPMPKPC